MMLHKRFRLSPCVVTLPILFPLPGILFSRCSLTLSPQVSAQMSCEYLLFACLDPSNTYVHPVPQVLTEGTKSTNCFHWV